MLTFPADLVKSDIEADVPVYIIPNDPACDLTEAVTEIHDGLTYASTERNRYRLTDCERDITWFTDRDKAVAAANLMRTNTVLALIEKARTLVALPPIV